MSAYIALLRAVNVGGNAKLPMSELRTMCEDAGFTDVRTYIASGNVVFHSDKSEAQVKAALEKKLAASAAYPIRVLVRTAAEMAAIVAANPFPQAPGNRVMALLLDKAPAADALERVKNRKDEELQAGEREIYIHYGEGMGSSRLELEAAREGTARNMNTLAKLAEMAAQA